MKYMFTYFSTVDRLKMYHDDTLGVFSLDDMVKKWAETHEIYYEIEKIKVSRALLQYDGATLVGYRLLEQDAILFKMEFNLAKFQDLTDIEYEVYDTL